MLNLDLPWPVAKGAVSAATYSMAEGSTTLPPSLLRTFGKARPNGDVDREHGPSRCRWHLVWVVLVFAEKTGS